MHNLFFILIFIVTSQSVLSQGKVENANHNNAPAIPQSETITNSVTSGNSIYLDSIQIFDIESENDVKSIQLEEKKSKPKANRSVKERQITKSVNDVFFELDKNKESIELTSSKSVALQQFSFIYDKVRTQDSRRSPTIEEQKQLDQTVENLKNIDRYSFEYHLKKFVSGNYNMDLKDHLTKAYEQKSTDSDVLNQLMAVAIIESDTVRAKMLFNQLMENNILGQAFIDYGSDVLVSAPAHSTLITHSFSDSYGVFYNQFSNSLRPDVTVINLDFCQSDYYRTQLQKKGYNIPPKTVIDTSFFSDFIGRNSDKIFAISLTVPKNYILSSPIELYTNGLVFSNKTEFESNVDLFEKKLNKKVLYQSSKTSKNLAFNYIPILLEIRKKYSEQGQIEKEREVDKLIDSIANSSNRENQINKMKNNN